MSEGREKAIKGKREDKERKISCTLGFVVRITTKNGNFGYVLYKIQHILKKDFTDVVKG